MLTLMGFGLTPSFGDRRGFMPPQLKTNKHWGPPLRNIKNKYKNHDGCTLRNPKGVKRSVIIHLTSSWSFRFVKYMKNSKQIVQKKIKKHVRILET